MSLLLAILGLGLLVVVHEAGHYLVARWSNMRVERFSIGFGPAVLSWKSGETQFQLAPIPFGGFVQIVGMNPHEEFDERDPRVYPNRPPLLRFLTILAGPAMNYVLAAIMMFAVYQGAGVETGTDWYRIGRVHSNSPAAESGLQRGDRIVAIDGHKVFARQGGVVQSAFTDAVQQSQGRDLVLRVERDGKLVDITLRARQLEPDAMGKAIEDMIAAVGQPVPERKLRLGIELAFEVERRNGGVGSAAAAAIEYPVETSERILSGLKKIVTREAPAEVKGPVGIVDDIEEEMGHGWAHALEVLSLLSVYLGLFNLLPLPGLDGGRLAFLTYELATRRRPNPRVEATVHMFGIVLFFLLLILVTFKDIRNLFG
jgi:regulator of sigma E protease